MTYWLIAFFFNLQTGDFEYKREVHLSTKAMCEMVATEVKKIKVKGYRVETVCVTDDHHSGRKQDPDIPLD